MRHCVALSTLISVPNPGRPLSIFIPTIGQKLDCVNMCVWIQINSSSVSDKQLGPWSWEGPMNCLVEGGAGDLLHVRIGSWQVRLIGKEGGACLNRYDMLREICLVCILPLTCHELGAFFKVLSEWKGGPGVLCCQLQKSVGMVPPGVVQQTVTGTSPLISSVNSCWVNAW